MSKFIRLSAAIVVFVVVVASWQSQKITRLYYVLTLFNPASIVDNFSNMDRVFYSAKLPSSPARPFKYQLENLPASYQYQGQQRQVNDFIKRTSTTALVVYKDANIKFERYYLGTNEFDLHISWSMAKSYLSALFGIALNEGHIKSVEQLVTDYVPSLKGSGYDGVSIKNVLQMSSGVAFNEDYGDFFSDINRFGRHTALGGTFDEFARSLVKEREQGTYMHYVSVDTHVLGMVLRAATGREFLDYFNDKLFSKLGSESQAYYVTDGSGEPMVLGGINMMARDYLRLGIAYLENGMINGEQVIPAHWVRHSVTPDAPHLKAGPRESSGHRFGYGYQWWIPERSEQEFFAWGIYGQFIYINQKLGVVIVKNSANTHFMENQLNDPIETIEMFRAIASEI